MMTTSLHTCENIAYFIIASNSIRKVKRQMAHEGREEGEEEEGKECIKTNKWGVRYKAWI